LAGLNFISSGVESFEAKPATALPRLLVRLSCLLFGHSVDNSRFRRAARGSRVCPCGSPYLQNGGEETRIRHTVSCFVGRHSYIRAGERSGHREYVCVQCGHPLLFALQNDPFSNEAFFRKSVRYLCNLFGHRVHAVTQRAGFSEYACECGHSFLKRAQHLKRVTHPPICLLAGHFVSHVEQRGDYSEYVCHNCGHTFLFAGCPTSASALIVARQTAEQCS
jgi:DNA-directed RNA polymerase subunit RPC12/RpoP